MITTTGSATPLLSRRFAINAAALMILLGFSSPAFAQAQPAKPMNVLFIAVDDLRAELGCYGGKALTPRLDALAKKGVMFEHAYCQYPLCCPSRSSMLTGRQPTTTNLYQNGEWVKAAHPEWDTLPEYFLEHGYVTLRAGKIFHGGIDHAEAWSEGGEPRRGGRAPSDRDVSTLPPITDAEEAERMERMLAADRGQAAGSDRWEASTVDPANEAGDTRTASRTIDFVKKHAAGDKPFFMACGIVKPHSALVAPKRFFDLYDLAKIQLPVDFASRPTTPAGFPDASIRKSTADLFIGREASEQQAREMALAYYACVSYADWNIGRVLDALDELKLAESTIVVVWGDHGYQLGEKGKWSKAGSLWEQGARVPMIIYDPRAAGNGTRCPRVVQLVDIYPTLVDLCGLPAAPGLDGVSLKPLLANPNAAWDKPAFTVWNERGRGITGVVVRTEQWRYAKFYGRGAGHFLTDPVNDPHELKNLADDPKYAEVVKKLGALIDEYAKGKTEVAAVGG